MNKKKYGGRIICALGLCITLAFFSSCNYLSSKGNSAFESTNLGDSREAVIARFDMPFVAKASGVPFPRYAAKGCESPCVERLWFQNRMSFDTEAWSIDFGKQGYVIDKYHWNSP
jgi:hypothetical protein